MSTLLQRQAAIQRALKRQTILRAQGLCLTCGREPAAPSRLRPGELATRCALCIDRRSAVRRGLAEPLRPRHAKAMLHIAPPDKPLTASSLTESIVVNPPSQPAAISWWISVKRDDWRAEYTEQLKRMRETKFGRLERLSMPSDMAEREQEQKFRAARVAMLEGR